MKRVLAADTARSPIGAKRSEPDGHFVCYIRRWGARREIPAPELIVEDAYCLFPAPLFIRSMFSGASWGEVVS
jgi:hypothetical protein